jgi:hypothetical protein
MVMRNTVFPSPRPSPLGRGRIVFRLATNQRAVITPPASGEVEIAKSCSLSPRERARARGNGADYDTPASFVQAT